MGKKLATLPPLKRKQETAAWDTPSALPTLLGAPLLPPASGKPRAGDAPRSGQGRHLGAGHLHRAPPTSGLRPASSGRVPREAAPAPGGRARAGRGGGAGPARWLTHGGRWAGGALAPRGQAERPCELAARAGTCAGCAGLRSGRAALGCWAGSWLLAPAGVGEPLGSACTGGRPSREGP